WAVQTVTSIAQTWDDVRIFIQCWVDACSDQTNWISRLRQCVHARLCGDKANGDDIGGTAVDEQLQRMQQRTSGCQHRIHQEHRAPAQIFWQGFQVRHWLVGFFIARHADKAHLGIRDHRQSWVNHAQACTNNGHNNRWIKQSSAIGGGNRGFAFEVLNRKISGSFINQHSAPPWLTLAARNAELSLRLSRIRVKREEASGWSTTWISI